MTVLRPELAKFTAIIADNSNSFFVQAIIDSTKLGSFFTATMLVFAIAVCLLITLGVLSSVLEKLNPNIYWSGSLKVIPYVVVLGLIASFCFILTVPHVFSEDFKTSPSAEALTKIDSLRPNEVTEAVNLLVVKGCFSALELKNPTVCSSDLQAALLTKATSDRYTHGSELAVGAVLTSWKEDVLSRNYLIGDVLGALKARNVKTSIMFEEYLAMYVSKLGSTPQTNYNFVKQFYASAESLKDNCGVLSKNNCEVLKAVYVNEVKKLAGEAIIGSNISKENYAAALEKAKSL